MTNLPQKNVNSIQFGKEIVHVNHVLIPGSPILKEKSLDDCSFSVDPKRTVKLQNFGILRNFLGSFRKSSAIVGSSSETLALGRKKISRLWLRKSWQVYIISQNFRKFRYKIKWKGIFRKLCFENSGQPHEVVLFSENLEIPEIFCSIWHSILKSICPTARAGSWLAILLKNANICFLGTMNGRPCGFPTGMRPVWINPWQTREHERSLHASLLTRK